MWLGGKVGRVCCRPILSRYGPPPLGSVSSKAQCADPRQKNKTRGMCASCELFAATIGFMNNNIFYIIGVIVVIVVVLKLIGLY